MVYSRHYIRSKLKSSRIVLRDPRLARYVPITRKLRKSLLNDMLNQYEMVYVKPTRGQQGVGVIRVEKRGGGYSFRSGVKTYSFHTFQAMYRALKKRRGQRSYVVQKGIRMLKYRRRPFDFRVMIQKKRRGPWVVTGTLARLAHPRKAVTNGSQGGTIYPAYGLMRRIAGKRGAKRLLYKMKRMAKRTAVQFGRVYPSRGLGIDIAVDHKLKPWILEVNTRPDPCPFTKLPSKKMIRRILSVARGYGKRYSLHCTKAKRGRL
ncbi:YheC/YheD family protein [Paenibacillus sp. NPDC056579]|uniref:YheC/YheD family protein n=1 Tax=Paenibacillus sp. NPDC056579 TaxID=3345871 RepID=UPI00367DEB9D